jgi:hypothetical protein
MRNISLISLLLALAAGAVLWQKLLVKSAPEREFEPAEYSSTLNDDERSDEDYTTGCEEQYAGTSECGSSDDDTEQDEMTEQRRRAHDTMMKSFDSKYDKYRDQINGNR